MPKKRPVRKSLTNSYLLGILYALGCILLVALTVWEVVSEPYLLSVAGLPEIVWTVVLRAAIIIAGYGLLKKRRWSWYVTFALVVVVSCLALIHIATDIRLGSIWFVDISNVLLSAIILYCLQRREIRGWFGFST